MSAHGPTIYDVAQHCGMSASTVSRAFSNPTRVSLVTRQEVHAAAREIGYSPRPLARVSAPERTRTVTLVVTDIANPFYAPLIKAAQAHAVRRGYTLSLTDNDESPKLEAANLRRLLATSSGGILATSRLSDETIRELAQHRPLVVVNRRIEGLPALIADTAGGMRKAARHLAALGHQRLAFLSGPRNSWVNGMRLDAVRDEASSLGIHLDLLGPFAPSRSGGHEAADDLTLRGSTAAIAYNDLIAIGTLERMSAKGVAVPAEFSIVGCDDIFGSDLTSPKLTTIGCPGEDIGARAVDCLHTLLCTPEPPPEALDFETHLVIRDSTAPPRGN